MARIYIPDKKLYAAVMFVRKILEDDSNKTFETACKISANYYKLNFDEVFETAEKYEHALAPTKGKKFKYFTCYREYGDDRKTLRERCCWPFVRRAIDRSHCYGIIGWVETHGGLGDDIPVWSVPIKEYKTKAEAKENVIADFNAEMRRLEDTGMDF